MLQCFSKCTQQIIGVVSTEPTRASLELFTVLPFEKKQSNCFFPNADGRDGQVQPREICRVLRGGRQGRRAGGRRGLRQGCQWSVLVLPPVRHAAAVLSRAQRIPLNSFAVCSCFFDSHCGLVRESARREHVHVQKESRGEHQPVEILVNFVRSREKCASAHPLSRLFQLYKKSCLAIMNKMMST